MSKVSIIGAYNTKFGNFVKRDRETKEIVDKGPTLYDLLIEAGRGALEDAGVEAKEIDAVYIGSYSSGSFNNQEHLGPLGIMVHPDLRFKPMTRVEAACASGTAAIFEGMYGIEAGRFKKVLVIAVEKMNELDTKGVTKALAKASYWPTEGAKGMTFPGLFAEYAKGYAKHYDIAEEKLNEMLANVAALCYKNALENPLAHFGKGGIPDKLGLTTADAILNLDDRKNPMIAPPLRLHDCSLVTDGAAAVVLTTTDIAKSENKKAVEIAGIGHTEEIMEETSRPQMYRLDAGKKAVEAAYKEAGITADDVDVAEVHDCFTINQILTTEALGFSEDGKAGEDYINGRFSKDDEKVCINLSGGLKAKGHPVGATGVSMHALLYKQLIGEPIGAAPTKKEPKVGAVFNVGGSGVSNLVSVLKKV
jgi:acetyl-CoA C-acetyltransferase